MSLRCHAIQARDDVVGITELRATAVLTPSSASSFEQTGEKGSHQPLAHHTSVPPLAPPPRQPIECNSNQSKAIFTTSPYYSHLSDHLGPIFVTHPLSESGDTYFTWRRNFMNARHSKNKFSFENSSTTDTYQPFDLDEMNTMNSPFSHTEPKTTNHMFQPTWYSN
ncbi:hypothetical protein RJ639_041963 [Escallonia herrerae]|uniref:Retrotransposon Copia-like N-terminal domain-containing protein n=1 Tax=Escallonia herrerae TaxID=1293975 RepID=A0AA88WDB0_9ASTE|nr:hypothetical protein RJ639_041963 [Escallonia herrerae]